MLICDQHKQSPTVHWDGGAFACLHAHTRTRVSHPAFAVFDEDAEGFDVEAFLFFGGVDGGFVVGVEGLEHEEAVAVDFDFFESYPHALVSISFIICRVQGASNV